MIVIYQNSKGRQYTFQLLEKDGETPRNITGLIITWRLKALDDPSVLLSAPGVITSALTGEFYIEMTTAISADVREYNSQFEVTDGAGNLLDPSEETITVIKKSTAVAG